MAKRSLGSLFIDIEARTARLEADLAKTRGLLQRLNAQVSVMGRGFSAAFGLAKGAIAAFASVAAIKSLKNMALGTLENVRAQMQLAEATALSVNDIKAYEEASEHLGVTNLNLAKTMKELFALQSDVRGGNKEATKQIQQMGFSVEQFSALKPAQLFESAVGGISKITDVSQRAALAQKVFGKEATNLSSLLSQGTGAIKTAREEMQRLGHTLTDFDTARVAVAMNAVSELGDRWEVFKKRLAIGLTPLLYTASMKLADLLGSIDIEKLAAKISSYALAFAGFVLTIPERVKRMLAEIQLMWYQFISQFDTGDKDGFLAKIFGTQADNKAKVEAVKKEIADLSAAITQMSGSLEAEFNQKVQQLLNKILTLPPVVSSVTTGISTGMREMVQEFTGAFSRLADLTDQFLDGESVKFGDWFREIVKTMVKTFLKVSLINPLLNAVFGGMMGGSAGGWWTNLPAIFGPGKARGGPAVAGDTALVGENGPELVTFGRSGHVIPTERIINRTGGGDGGPRFNFNMNFASGLQKAELAAIVPSIIQQAKAAVADAALRGGGFRRAVSG